MHRSAGAAVASALCAAANVDAATAFSLAGPAPASAQEARFLARDVQQPSGAPAWGKGVGAAAVLAAGAVAARAATTGAKRQAKKAASTVVPLSSSVFLPSSAQTIRDQLLACHAQFSEGELPSVKAADDHMAELEAAAKKMAAGTASAVVFAGAMADTAVAYPIFAQQNYANPQEANGRIACANCHLQARGIDARVPHEVLPDTIFKMMIEIPAKYEKRRQLNAEGQLVEMNVGAIAIMPEGWKLAPKDRLPKVIKKEMKGLAWAPYSKDKPNIVVAGPVPGARYEKMILPVLAPDPNKTKGIYFEKVPFFFGGNRGRGQVYPEGNMSNNNVFQAKATGTIKSIEGDAIKKVTIEKADGSLNEQEVLAGATFIVSVGDKVKAEQPLTTNPNVGGFGQWDADIVLQDVNRTQAYEALALALFVAQLSFVLKKKQFEKVQLAEGF